MAKKDTGIVVRLDVSDRNYVARALKARTAELRSLLDHLHKQEAPKTYKKLKEELGRCECIGDFIERGF